MLHVTDSAFFFQFFPPFIYMYSPTNTLYFQLLMNKDELKGKGTVGPHISFPPSASSFSAPGSHVDRKGRGSFFGCFFECLSLLSALCIQSKF